jgi:hypothetical protein
MGLYPLREGPRVVIEVARGPFRPSFNDIEQRFPAG